jgi:hypothetical protein
VVGHGDLQGEQRRLGDLEVQVGEDVALHAANPRTGPCRLDDAPRTGWWS